MPLRVLIVGAGPVGLAAAIALAGKGHEVEMFEKSAFSREIGAAMQFAPQAVRMLDELGVSTEDLNGRPCERWCYFDDLSVGAKPSGTAWEWREVASRLGLSERQVMVHRVDAHDALRKKALSYPNVRLVLPRDLVVGADGVHSAVAKSVATDEDMSAHYGPLNIYRFLVSTDDMQSDPLVSEFFGKLDWQNSFNSYRHAGRFLTSYPCRGLSLLNCATFLRRDLDQGPIAAGTWNTPGTREELFKALDGFPDQIRRLVDMANDIKHWSTVMRHCTKTYVKGRTVLIGDAAHPMAPTHGAGAGTGVEDAYVLATILDESAVASEVEALLRLYNNLRYERGTIMKYASHAREDPEGSATKLKELVPGAEIPVGMVDYIWAYNGIPIAKNALAKYRATKE